ncbi:MAG: DAK2 domain-containing protein [Dehalococcoidia bacterium]|nr:DAK2 domain-containing protein [Dehalococcoidia bacterium]MQY81298.1 DAK2 domain-containing protein [Dehalococcoidia bacterium]TET48534.1 MAG: DAK2 domain-containing protein [Dehalococcoidia bacterium]
MKQIKSISGQELREMFAAATGWLEKSSAEIDALNVFPVPDGDTGTNMLLTMRSTIEEAYRAPDHSASAVAHAMAHGALMGARGNSGVILSQILRGLAQSLTEKESLTATDLAGALQESAVMAYKGMSNPVEGTMLTVIKDIATAVQAEVAGDDGDVVAVMETAVNAAGESVANTPNLLDVLRQAGVVDAGGQGLHTIFDGALRYLKGEMEQMRFRKPQIIVTDMHATKLPQMIAADEIPYGYCTEFLLKGEKLDTDKMRKKLEKKGESLIVVGDEATARVHIHTLEPGDVISYASSLGTLHQVSIRNMDEQHHDYLEIQKDRGPAVDTAIVAVVAGEGLADVFTSLGVTAIVPGGQTMNPSTKDLLQAVEEAASDKVIILPNNKNIVATANQVQSLTEKKIEVVPTTTIPQGVAALLAFDYEANLESNIQIMTRAMATVKTIEICRAVRSAKLEDLKIKKKQPIGFLDGDMVVVGESGLEVLNKMLSKLNLSKVEVITIYYGADTKSAEAEQVASDIRSRYPQLQIEVVRGGQPHYNYIISIE